MRRKLLSDQISTLDSKFERLDIEQTIQNIIAKNIDILGITAMTNEINSAALLASELKKRMPDIKIVIGGVHITALPEDTMREFPQFDYGVIGEGEQSFLDLINHIKDKTQITSSGICFLENDHFKTTGPSTPLSEQDEIFPAWDMFKPAKEYMLQTARGCPFACHFCMNPGGRIVRSRSVDVTLDEIDELIKTKNPESIYFGDEIFTLNKKRVIELCQGMIDRGIHKKITWWCQTHVNTLDQEIVKIMKEAGCILVGLGIEAGDEEKLKKMGKGITKAKIKKAIEILKKEKLNFDTMFILGQPNETKESAKKTIDFAVELNPSSPIFGLMVPYPGTKVGQMALNQQGGYKLKSRNWDHFNKQIGNALELEGISRRDLEILQFLGYIKVFLYNFRLIDLLKFCFKYKSEGFTALKKIAFSS